MNGYKYRCKVLVIIAILTLGTSLISSCNYHKQDELYGNTTCDTAQIGYTIIQNQLEQQCYACHTASAPSGNVVLYDYNSLKTYASNSKSTLLGALKHTTASPMPKGGQKWDACAINKLEAWINQGMKP